MVCCAAEALSLSTGRPRWPGGVARLVCGARKTIDKLTMHVILASAAGEGARREQPWWLRLSLAAPWPTPPGGHDARAQAGAGPLSLARSPSLRLVPGACLPPRPPDLRGPGFPPWKCLSVPECVCDLVAGGRPCRSALPCLQPSKGHDLVFLLGGYPLWPRSDPPGSVCLRARRAQGALRRRQCRPHDR